MLMNLESQLAFRRWVLNKIPCSQYSYRKVEVVGSCCLCDKQLKRCSSLLVLGKFSDLLFL